MNREGQCGDNLIFQDSDYNKEAASVDCYGGGFVVWMMIS